MKDPLEALRLKWQGELEGWLHAAEMSRADEGVSSRCMVRAQTLQGCLDDLKNHLKLP